MSKQDNTIDNLLAQCQEALDDARLLLENNRFRSAVNRLYYACFYSVQALLYTKSLSSVRHSGVRSLFELHWIKSARLPKETGRFYHALFDLRIEADYNSKPFEAGEEDTRRLLDDCEAFIGTIVSQIQSEETDT